MVLKTIGFIGDPLHHSVLGNQADVTLNVVSFLYLTTAVC